MAVVDEVKTIVRLLMQRPITEEIAREVEVHQGFEHLEIVDRQWVGFHDDPRLRHPRHDVLVARIRMALTLWASHTSPGSMLPAGIGLVQIGTADDIQVLRRPDAALSTTMSSAPAAHFAYRTPLLVVEAVSPTEKPYAIRRLMDDYRNWGVQRVWQVYPQSQEIVVTFADGTYRTYRAPDIMTDPGMLSGFALDVAKVFED